MDNETLQLKEILNEEFKHDPLRREIRVHKLEEYLFTDNILAMHPKSTYSTVDAGKILGRKDSTIRNYFQGDLVHYIKPEKSGIYYRLNYRSIFKLHMILLLIDKARKTTAELAEQVGIGSTVIIGKDSGGEVIAPSNSKEMENLKQLLGFQSIKTDLLEENNRLLDMKLRISNIETQEKSLQSKIDNLSTKNYARNLERRHQQLLTYSLQKSLDQKKMEKKGFLNWFRKSDADEVSNETAASMVEEATKLIEDEIDYYKKDEEKMELQLKELQEEKETLENQLKILESRIAQKQNDLLQYKGQLKLED